MKGFILLCSGLLLIFSACSDNFTDPNPGYEEIIDSIKPVIDFNQLKEDSTYTGSDTVFFSVRYTDDLLLDIMNFTLVGLDPSAYRMDIVRSLEDTFFSLDTFYVKPAGLDSLRVSVVSTCDDYANNSTTQSVNFLMVN